jgi:hypothetical protein
MLKIFAGEKLLNEAETALLTPADAPEYPDKFRGETTQSAVNAKHAYHALAQIAFFDYEDKILEVVSVPPETVLTIRGEHTQGQVDEGLIVARDAQGKVRVFAHEGQDLFALLKFAHRYCTRWIRLDI